MPRSAATGPVVVLCVYRNLPRRLPQWLSQRTSASSVSAVRPVSLLGLGILVIGFTTHSDRCLLPAQLWLYVHFPGGKWCLPSARPPQEAASSRLSLTNWTGLLPLRAQVPYSF